MYKVSVDPSKLRRVENTISSREWMDGDGNITGILSSHWGSQLLVEFYERKSLGSSYSRLTTES